jgi:hypothetical protein
MLFFFRMQLNGISSSFCVSSVQLSPVQEAPISQLLSKAVKTLSAAIQIHAESIPNTSPFKSNFLVKVNVFLLDGLLGNFSAQIHLEPFNVMFDVHPVYASAKTALPSDPFVAVNETRLLDVIIV